MELLFLLLPLLVALEVGVICTLIGVDPSVAVVRGAVLGTGAIVTFINIASVFRHLTGPATIAGWALAAAGLGAVTGWLARRREYPGNLLEKFRERLRAVLLEEWLGASFLILLLSAELFLALHTLPSSLDSLTYHLPRIEHWRVNHSVLPYPAMIDRQVLLAPGGEYLMLTLRLLSDSIRVAPLVPWFSCVGSIVAVHRIAGQLGCGRRGRLAAAIFAGTVPLVIMQASSSLTDLVVAFFLLCFASLVLDFRGTPGVLPALLAGLALGEAVLTKSTALPLAVGFGLWWTYLLVRQGWKGIAWGGLGAAMTLAVVGPFLFTTAMTWGSPLGPADLSNQVMVGRHDPVTIAMNAVKIASGALVSSDPVETKLVCEGARAIHRETGQDISDPATSFHGWPFACQYDLGETAGSVPWHGPVAAVIVATAAVCCSGRRRAYALAVGLGALIFVATIAYQYWVTRLWIGGLVLGCPLLPVAISRIMPKATQLAAAVTGGILLVGSLSGGSALASGSPRPLLSRQTLSPGTPGAQLVPRYPELARAADQVLATGARRIGLVGYPETQEFALWVLLGATEDRTSIVILNSAVPGQQSPPGKLDAILCIPPTSPKECQPYVPAGWRTNIQPGGRGVLVALPPS